MLAFIANSHYIVIMQRKQICVSLKMSEADRLDSILNGRTIYAFALEAIREKMQREEGANK